jgi:hypothetical protein
MPVAVRRSIFFSVLIDERFMIMIHAAKTALKSTGFFYSYKTINGWDMPSRNGVRRLRRVVYVVANNRQTEFPSEIHLSVANASLTGSLFIDRTNDR